AHGGVRVRQASELVGVFLPGLILEGVGVHRVEVQAARGGELLQLAGVLRLVPGDVERDSGRRADELKDGRAIFKLLEDAARLAGAGKAREARPARADAPRGDGDAELLRLRREVFDLHV